jgi:N-hydroxyarylamine O-acetyltransferase
VLDTAAYLARIGYRGDLTPNAETLAALHQAHLQRVPFENLDIPLRRPLSLELSDLYTKIVVRRRGGFCYELNGLFAALLEGLGFRVAHLSARVTTTGGGFGPEFDHLALLVHLEERWLADVGFGDSFLRPLRLDERGPQLVAGQSFRISEQDGQIALERLSGDAWQTEYLFTEQPHPLADFAAMCHYHQTAAESPFTRKRLCSRATPAGRVTISNNRLIVTDGGAVTETILTDEQSVAAALWGHFGVDLSLK